MSLKDEKWPLWSKKEGKKTWEMRHEVRFNYMEIWNSKFGGNMYSNFEDKFGVLPKVHLDILHISFRSSRSQESNASNDVQIKIEMNKLWSFEDNYAKLKDHFEIQLIIWNLTYEFEIQFEMTPILNSPTATLMFCFLYLSNCI